MHGDVSFIELGSSESDTARSQAFFQTLFGWEFRAMPQGGGWFQTPRIRIGLHGNDPAQQMYVFFEVPDLEAAMATVRAAGGQADPPMKEEPEFGKFSSCRDPLGIRFGLHQL